MKKTMIIGICIALSVCITGCSTNPLLEPADMFANQTVGPEYVKYVQADTKLSDTEKKMRLNNVEAFKKLIKAGKE